MKKFETLLVLTVIAVCSVSLVGCKQKASDAMDSEAAAMEKPVPTSPEAMLPTEEKPAAAETVKPAGEEAAPAVEAAKPATE